MVYVLMDARRGIMEIDLEVMLSQTLTYLFVVTCCHMLSQTLTYFLDLEAG